MIDKKNKKMAYASTAAKLLYNLFSANKKKYKNNDSSSSECSCESYTSSSSSCGSSEEKINFDKKKEAKRKKKKSNTTCYYNNCTFERQINNDTKGSSGSHHVENFNLNIKMNQIYYRLRDLYKVHQILSSSVRIQENVHDTKMIVKKNLRDISEILCKIRTLVKGKYYYKHYFNNYVKYFQLLVQQLNDNVDDNIVVIMKLDTLIQKWYKLHEIYYIQTKS